MLTGDYKSLLYHHLYTGMYTFLLTVEDNTAARETGIYGNVRYARKFVLFDDQNRVEIMRENDVIVETATTNTSHRWIVNHHQEVDPLRYTNTN